MKAHRCSVAFTCAVFLGGLAGGAHAQTARSGGAPNAQLLQQMQQLASERTSLQADNAKLKKQLDDAHKELDGLKKTQQGAAQRARASATALSQSAAQRNATEAELTQLKSRSQELVTKFRETVRTLQQIEVEGTTMRQTLASRDEDLKSCRDQNEALYKLNGEVLTHFDQESSWSRMARAEPFTQIKRVQLENLVDNYRARAREQKLPVAPNQPVAPRASPAPSPPGS